MSKDKKTQEDWQKIDEIMKQWAKETFQFEPVSTEPFNDFNHETQTTQPVEQLEKMLLDTLDSLAAKYHQNESTAFSEGDVISRKWRFLFTHFDASAYLLIARINVSRQAKLCSVKETNLS